MVSIPVSVIIPTYNRKKLLLRAIKSVLYQTYLPDEIIIVDDNSDFSVDKYINDGLEHKDFFKKSNLRVISNECNIGAAASRNKGVAEAKNELIAFLDSDDWWEKDKIEKQYNIMTNNPLCGLVYCGQYEVYSNSEFIQSNKILCSDNLWHKLIKGWSPPNTSTLLIRRSAFRLIEGFDNSLTSCQDNDLWMKIAFNKITVNYYPGPLSFFSREAQNRISFDTNKRLHGAILFLEKWKVKIIDNNGFLDYYRYKSYYMYKVTIPIINKYYNNKQYFNMSAIFIRYMSLNYIIYYKLFKFIFNRLISDN